MVDEYDDEELCGKCFNVRCYNEEGRRSMHSTAPQPKRQGREIRMLKCRQINHTMATILIIIFVSPLLFGKDILHHQFVLNLYCNCTLCCLVVSREKGSRSGYFIIIINCIGKTRGGRIRCMICKKEGKERNKSILKAFLLLLLISRNLKSTSKDNSLEKLF